MSEIGDLTVRVCNSLHHLPSLIICFLLIIIQAATIDYYLIHHIDIQHSFWFVCDVIVVMLFIACFQVTSQFEHNRKYIIVWVTWLVLQSALSAKVIVICTNFSTELDDEETSFFGPNTLKTAIALGSCIYVLLLTSQHDAPLASERRRYIEELSGTVVFDILDTADILEILFDKEERPSLSSGLPEVVLSVATLNLLLPTVPLITLSKTKFGLEKLQRRWIYLHRLLVVLAVNVPNLILRMALWHIYSVAVSPFTLKNFILIFMTLYEFYEHKKDKYEEHERETIELEQNKLGRNNTNSEKGPKQNETTSGNAEITQGKIGAKRTEQIRDYNIGKDSSNFEAVGDKEVHFDIETRFVSAL